jgi:hypothetical protein
LRTFAKGLVVDESLEGTNTVLLVQAVDGDRGLDEAAALYHAGTAARIIVIDGPPRRTTRMGITKSFGTIARGALADRRVPTDAIVMLHAQTRSEWGTARVLAGWLHDCPGARVRGLCSQFSSRRIAHVFATALDDANARRVSWRSLPDRRFDETNWWHCKAGVLAFFNGYLCLGHAWWFGEPAEQTDWEPDEYVRSLCAA